MKITVTGRTDRRRDATLNVASWVGPHNKEMCQILSTTLIR